MDRCVMFVSLVAMACYLLCSGTYAATLTAGQCPNVSVVQNFEPKRYEGLWFEVSRSIEVLELGGRCAKVQYQLNGNSSDFGAIYSLIRDGKERRLSAKASPVDASKKEGRYIAEVDVFSLYIILNVQISAPYLLLDTDYDHFAIVYSCFDVDVLLSNIGGVVILSREPVLEQIYKDRINATLQREGLSDKTLKDISQNCE